MAAHVISALGKNARNPGVCKESRRGLGSWDANIGCQTHEGSSNSVSTIAENGSNDDMSKVSCLFKRLKGTSQDSKDSNGVIASRSENAHDTEARGPRRREMAYVLMWALLFCVFIRKADGMSPSLNAYYPIDHLQSLKDPKAPYCSSKRIVNHVSNIKQLEDCEVIEGDLEIVLIESRDDLSAEWRNYSYPKLVQITGFLLVYRVNGLVSLGQLFPNLAVIRGMTLHQQYALVIYEALQLMSISLYSLTSILRGSVRLQNNFNLCHVQTVDWSAITKKEMRENVFKNNNKDMCGPCSSSSDCYREKCWSSKSCQKICRSECEGGCTADGSCCHRLCVGGCHEPHNDSACFACQNVSHRGRCVESCPSKIYYKYLEYRCVTEKECVDMKDHMLYVSASGEQKCLRECPRGYQKGSEEHPGGVNIPKCNKCNGTCSKVCPVQFINSIEKARNFAGCTIVDGPLIISITGGKHIVKELTMNLDSIQEVRDYVRVFSTSALRSLEFLRSLKVIGGRNLYNSQYALYVHGNDNLETIWDWNMHGTLTITKRNARVMFHSNPQLCYTKIQELLELTGRDADAGNLDMRLSNGNKVACKIQEQSLELEAWPRRGVVKIRWHAFLDSHDERMLTGYYVYYKPSEENVTYLAGRDACDDDWAKKYVETEKNDRWIVRYLKGLRPNRRYAVYVETDTVGDADNGSRSPISYATTKPFNPGSPKKLKVEKREKDRVTVSWSTPLQDNGPIDHYVVTIKPYPYQETEACPPMPGPNALPESNTHDEELANAATPTAVDQDNETTSSLDNEAGECCACPQESRWLQRQQDIAFEDKLFSWVYEMHNRRKRHAFGDDSWTHRIGESGADLDDLDSIAEPPASMRCRHNKDRQMAMLHDVPESYSDVLRVGNDSIAEVPEPIPSPYIEPGTFKQNESEDTRSPWERIESTRNMTVTIAGLRHFTRYLIKVVACHPPPKELSDVPKSKREVLCSLHAASTSVITQAKDGANKVSNIEVKDGHQTGVKLVSWEPPKDPNGELLAYIVTMQPQNLDTYWSTRAASQHKCISAQEFENGNRSYELNEKDFAPGLYFLSIKVHTNSFVYTNESYGNLPIEIKAEGLRAASLDISIWVVACVLLLVFMVTVAIVLFRTLSGKPEGFVTENPRYDPGPPTLTQRIHSLFHSDEILDMQDLELDEGCELGKGNFGLVLKGTLKTKNTTKAIAAKVATAHQEKDDIIQEAKLMLKLKCYHLVEAYGIAVCPRQVYLVMEFMARGSLLAYLRELDIIDNDIFLTITVDRICAMGIQIADGMAYLASNRIVHRDLAARNCLIDDQLNIKISDFGMSRLTGNDYYQNCNTRCFPVRWLPPEYIANHRFTCQSDVWSYGIVLWEILSKGATPYNNMKEDKVIEQVKMGYTLKSQLPEGMPGFLTKVIASCWNFHDRQRPYFPQIIASLLPYTSPWFSEHFRMVSFYHSAEGLQYQRHLETLLKGEEDTYFALSVTSASSPLGISDVDPRPPPLPARPFLGLKWPTSLSFRERTTPRMAGGSTETPALLSDPDVTLPRTDPGNGTDDDVSVAMPDDPREFPSSANVSVNRKTEFAGASTSGLTDTEASSDFRDLVIPKDMHNSNSGISLCSEYRPKQARKMRKNTSAYGKNMIVRVNSRGGATSSITPSLTLRSASIGTIPKALKNFRSRSSPNIEPTVC